MDGPTDGGIDATPDADPCAPFTAPAGSKLFHDKLCNGVFGYNPGANPTGMTLACPGAGTTAGTYGLVRRPESAEQADGCTATSNITRITAPAAAKALTQASTGETLTVVAGDQLRVRIACAAQSAGNCRGNVQITGRANGNSPITRIYPDTGFQRFQGQDVVDVEVPMPAALVGTTTEVIFIVLYDGVDVPDLLFENPHLK